MIYGITAGAHLETGKLVSPSGVSYVGFKLTFTDPSGAPMDALNYDDINAMVHKHPEKVYLTEERTPDGHFKAIHGSTEPI